MIQQPTWPPRIYNITAYDFEWDTDEEDEDLEVDERGNIHKKHRLRLCGAYDERGYRAYKTVEAFMNGELIEENMGRRYYAHFGGASDMIFLLQPLIQARANYRVRAAFSSSSAIIVDVREPNNQDRNRKWTFLDSFWTMRVPLAKIGAWLGRGFAKGKVDFSKASFAELAEYNEQDCHILWEAMTRMQNIILDIGGELGPTIASTALKIITRRYLKKPLNNSADVDDKVRPGYCASKSQKYQERCENAYYYDINSSFPTSMSAGFLPGELLCTLQRRLPKNLEKKPWIARVRVKVPDQYNPPLPYRHDGRVFFPVGEFDTTICGEDLLCGDFDITKVYESMVFEERDDLRDFAIDMYRRRLASEGFDSQVFKICVNSGYGKWTERSLKAMLVVRPDQIDPRWPADAMLAPGIYLVEEDVPVKHSHVPWGLYITARSRRYLRELENIVLKQKKKLYYSDCDAVLSDATFPESGTEPTHVHGKMVAATGQALGELKLEAKVKKGRFLASKLYALETEEGIKVKAKGFARAVSSAGKDERLTYEDFVKLEEGQRTRVLRMKRLRELIRESSRRSGRETIEFDPESIIMKKRLRLDKNMPKRKPLPNGDSRPWNLEEIEAA